MHACTFKWAGLILMLHLFSRCSHRSTCNRDGIRNAAFPGQERLVAPLSAQAASAATPIVALSAQAVVGRKDSQR